VSFTKAIVIGSSGQVSRALRLALSGKEVIFTSSSGEGSSLKLDLGDAESIREAFLHISRRMGSEAVEVFLAGAMTHVDNCEREQDKCKRVNSDGPIQVARECKALGFGLTYFSTEYIFGGAEYEGGPVGPFSETDSPYPTSFYGQCKLEAEEGIREIFGEDALIIRTTMVYSFDPSGMNFLMQYLRQLENGEKPFRIPIDQISTPTYAPALAEATVALREKSVGGIFNLVGPDLLSRRELVEKVAAAFGFSPADVNAKFQFVKTSDLGQAARRPLTAGLRIDKARTFKLRLDSLDEAFAEVGALRRASVVRV